MRMENGKYNGASIPKVELGYWAGTIRRWINIMSPKLKTEIFKD